MQPPVLTPAAPVATASSSAAALPICVDLDGTLSKSDTLVDSLFALARQQPTCLWRVPGWLARGKAGFKQELAKHVTLDVEHLPYNQPLLEWLRAEHASGREILLTTGADVSIAERVAAHLGIFSGVLASCGEANLTGENKLLELRQRFPNGFCYAGNAAPDFALLQAANESWLANPTRGLRGKLRGSGAKIAATHVDRAPLFRTLRRTVRAQQWAKNVLLFLPLLLGHASDPKHRAIAALLGFVAFCMAASATYILNDLVDIEADRRHLRKRTRPFAAGDISAFSGLLLAVVLLAGGAGLCLLLPLNFAFWLAAYFVTTTAYSLALKRIPLVDVLVLAGLYTVRILAGGAASQVAISPWLAGFSLFFFLSLAFVKRYAELHNLRLRNAVAANGRGYLVGDIDELRSFGIAAGYASVVVFSLYINAPIVAELYRHPTRLWLLAPILIFWISRVWLVAGRGQLDEDPVIFAITDRVSLFLGMLTALCVWSAI